MKLLIMFVLFIPCGILHAQKTNGVQFIINPFLQDFGNLEKRYTIQDCETIYSEHKKYPSFELGGLYHHNFKGKWGWGAGLTYRFAKYESDYMFTVYENPENVRYEYHTVSEVHYSIIKLQASYQLNERIKLNSFVNVELPVFEYRNESPNYLFGFGVTNHYTTQNGVVSQPVQYNSIRIIQNGYYGIEHVNITPEIYVSYEVHNGLHICAGFRFKFWKANHPIIQAKVDGFTGPENYDNQGTIYLSEVNNKDFSVVLGLMYEFKRTKSEKN